MSLDLFKIRKLSELEHQMVHVKIIWLMEKILPQKHKAEPRPFVETLCSSVLALALAHDAKGFPRLTIKTLC